MRLPIVFTFVAGAGFETLGSNANAIDAIASAACN
jgi:hypothetical protein